MYNNFSLISQLAPANKVSKVVFLVSKRRALLFSLWHLLMVNLPQFSLLTTNVACESVKGLANIQLNL